MKKIILVTGTSTGLGVSITVKLAQKGHKVYATMRNLNKKELLEQTAQREGVELVIKQLDVQDSTSINTCVANIISSEGRIDTLINNAGAGFVRTTEQANEDEMHWIMDVNFMGVVRCTKAVLPHMRQSRGGHVINISSVGGLVGQPFNEIYCAAKFAVEGYVESVSTYITPHFNIHFTNVEPGGISSEFASNVLTHVKNTGGILDDEYRPILEKYMSGAGTRREGVYQSTDEVAEVVINCVENEEPPIRVRTSEWAEVFSSLKTELDPTGKKQQQKVIKEFLS